MRIDLAGSQRITFEMAESGRIGFQCEPNQASTSLNDAIGALSGSGEPWVNLLAVATDDRGVRPGKVEILPLFVVPLDQVGRFTVVMADLEHHAVAIWLTHPMSRYYDSVTNLCKHENPYLRPSYSLSTPKLALVPVTEVRETKADLCRSRLLKPGGRGTW